MEMRRRILLMSLGSRGDMEPFLALGEELSQKGHTVAFCFPEQFEKIALEVSPHFYAQDPGFYDLINKPEVRKILGQVGSVWSRMRAGLALSKEIKPLQEKLIYDQEAAVEKFQPDEIVFHIKCIYPVFWSIQTRGKVKILSPMPCMLDVVKHEPHIGFGNPGPIFWNLLTYKLALWGLVTKSVLGYGESFIKKRNLKIKAKRLREFYQNDVLVEYPISSQLFTRPVYWPQRAEISDFRERNKQQHYEADKPLLNFLDKHPRPIFISFGSMVNAQPKQIGLDIVAVAQKHCVPIIINTSWGGIELPDGEIDFIHSVSDIPYDFLFPRVSAAIHHGGSGTTHSALRCQVPQAIVPHIGDQFFWNRCIETSGVGVKGFPVSEWSISKFEALLLELLAFSEQKVSP